jgi:hypothetical protein
MPPDETTTEEKSSRSYWGFALWLAAILVLYPLSVGPAIRAWDKGIISRRVMQVYAPLERVVHGTFLEGPCEQYIHFWNPGLYDKGPTWLDAATRQD